MIIHISFFNSGIPQGQAFQRVKTILQPERSSHTGISWIDNNITRNNENDMKKKPLESSK